jgi:gamma-glutamylcyclotransferase (GGCT)/AIG2-like uncharacterized protein YtfP
VNTYRLRELFVGSSTDALGFVNQLLAAIAKNPAREAIKLIPWNADVFRPSQMTLETLLNKLPDFDGAVFILMDKDKDWDWKTRGHNPSENIYFEIGLAMGKLGPDNVVIVQSDQVVVPSDLSGFTTIRVPENPDPSDAQRVVEELRKHFSRLPPALSPGQGKLIEITETLEDFYERFQNYLRHSKDFVFLIGSGFECTDDVSLKRAETYLRVLTGCALRHRVIRIETGTFPRMAEWLQMVATYLAPLRNVEIYKPKEPTSFLFQDMCLIDPGTENAIVEFMFGTEKAEKGRRVERPGVGVFLQSTQATEVLHRRLADYLNILQQVTPEELLSAHGISHSILRGSEKVVRYFTYGSNMSLTQITDRMPTARFVGTGRLPGYRLVFGTTGTIFRDSVATIYPDQNSEVWGGIAEVSEHDLNRMDFYEGVQQGEYARIKVNVESASSGMLEQLPTYCSQRRVREGRPSPEYLGRLLSGALELGLPNHYLEFLQSLKHSDE